MRRVPFDERLWRPEQFLGEESRLDRERTLTYLEGRREAVSPPLAALALQEEEHEPGYRARVRDRILGVKPETVTTFPRLLTRVVGER